MKQPPANARSKLRNLTALVVAAIGAVLLSLPVRYELYCLRHSDKLETMPELVEWYGVGIGTTELPGDACWAYPELYFTYPCASSELLHSTETKYGKDMRLVRVNESSRFCSSITVEPLDGSMVPFEVASYVCRTSSDGGNWTGFGVWMHESYESAVIEEQRAEICAIAEKYGFKAEFSDDRIKVYIDSAEKAEAAARFCVETDMLLGGETKTVGKTGLNRYPKFFKVCVYADSSLFNEYEYSLCSGLELFYHEYDRNTAEETVEKLTAEIQSNINMLEKYH